MITAAEQAVIDIAAQGPDGFSDRVDAHAAKLVAAGDVAGLCEFTQALIAFSRVIRERAEQQSGGDR